MKFKYLLLCSMTLCSLSSYNLETSLDECDDVTVSHLNNKLSSQPIIAKEIVEDDGLSGWRRTLTLHFPGINVACRENNDYSQCGAYIPALQEYCELPQYFTALLEPNTKLLLGPAVHQRDDQEKTKNNAKKYKFFVRAARELNML